MEMSKLTNFKKSLKFYINQIITGKKTKDEIHLTFSNSNPHQVLINKNVLGTIKCPEDEYLNQYEIIMSEIANLFDVDSACIYHLTNENDESALFCKSVCTSNELLITMDYVFKKLYEKYSKGPQHPTHWMSEALRIPASTAENPLTDESHLKTLIDMGINATLEAFTIPEKELDELKTKYFSMILFDFLTNQEKRNAIDYSVIVNKGSKGAKLSPIYSYSETPNDKLYYFNNRLTDRHALIKVLYQNYYSYIKENSRCITEHSQSYIKSIRLICENNTDAARAEKIIESIHQNIAYIRTLEQEQSGQILTETKVDYTQTTIRVNQKVMKKNLLVQNKYPEKLMTSIEVENLDIKEDEGVKISIEEPLKQSGFSNAFIITSAIAFICGLGAGVAYILLMIYK